MSHLFTLNTKLWNVAYALQRNNELKFGAVLIWGDTEQEATGLAYGYITEKYPTRKGWTSPNLTLFEVDDLVIITAHRLIMERRRFNQ